MRFKAEQGHAANNGIVIAIELLEPIKEQFPVLSHADFYQVPFCRLHNFILTVNVNLWSGKPYVSFHSIQLAGVVAVEITGGPDVPFHPGRVVSDFFFVLGLDMLSCILFINRSMHQHDSFDIVNCENVVCIR